MSTAAPRPRRFAYVVCGSTQHTRTLDTSLRHLERWSDLEVVVVTDQRRNEEPIDHPGTIDVRTPTELDHHQASIHLKTGLHRFVPEGADYCYLDSDIIAVGPGVDDVFVHAAGPVTFAPDLTIRENTVDRFSPWALNCECQGIGAQHSCAHLRQAIRRRWGVDVPGDWVHWNGGVFLFAPDRSAEFLDRWNAWAVETFDDPYWRTRDQGALIAATWSFGLQDQPVLPTAFNFIADLGNGDLSTDPERGFALHEEGPWVHPSLLHLYTSELDAPGWDIERDLMEVIRANMAERARVRHSFREIFTTLHSLRGTAAAAAYAGAHLLRVVRRRVRARVVAPEVDDGAPWPTLLGRRWRHGGS